MPHDDQDLLTEPAPPQTSHPEIDQAVAGADFSGDVADHPRQIEALLDTLQSVLQAR